jgi:hypothetical protein
MVHVRTKVKGFCAPHNRAPGEVVQFSVDAALTTAKLPRIMLGLTWPGGVRATGSN